MELTNVTVEINLKETRDAFEAQLIENLAKEVLGFGWL